MVDTHALVWHITGDAQLSHNAKRVLDNPGVGNRLAVPTIVLAEAWDLDRKGRRQPAPWPQIEAVIRASGIMVSDVDFTVIRTMQKLWSGSGLNRNNYDWPDIHDLMILATAIDLEARYGQASIISKDRKLRNEQSLISCVW